MKPVIALLLALSACAQAPVKMPEKVYITVEKFKALPPWALAPVPNEAPKDSLVESLVQANNTRASTLDIVNCRIALLGKLDRGEVVNPKDCDR